MIRFQVGDKAVYPAQGVAEIVGIDEKEISGKIHRFYCLRILDTDMRILVPIDKADQVGLREDVQQEQIKTLQVQYATLEKEKARTERLIKADAAPTKQLDDIVAQMNVIKQQIQTDDSQIDLVKTQINAQKSMVNIQNRGILSEQKPLKDKANQVDDFLKSVKLSILSKELF